MIQIWTDRELRTKANFHLDSQDFTLSLSQAPTESQQSKTLEPPLTLNFRKHVDPKIYSENGAMDQSKSTLNEFYLESNTQGQPPTELNDSMEDIILSQKSSRLVLKYPKFDGGKIIYDSQLFEAAQSDCSKILSAVYDQYDIEAMLTWNERNLIVSYEKAVKGMQKYLERVAKSGNEKIIAEKDGEIDRLIFKIQEIRLEQCEDYNLRHGAHKPNIKKGGRSMKNTEQSSEEENLDPVNDGFMRSIKKPVPRPTRTVTASGRKASTKWW